MRPSMTLAVAVMAGPAAAGIDLYLFKGKDCTGELFLCKDAEPGHCCHSGETYWSSGSLSEGPDSVKLTSFVADGPFDCKGPYTADEPLLTCIAHQELPTRALTYRIDNKRSIDELPKSECDDAIPEQKNHMYSNGTSIFVVSKSKVQDQALKIPTTEEGQAKFFEAHADDVIPVAFNAFSEAQVQDK